MLQEKRKIKCHTCWQRKISLIARLAWQLRIDFFTGYVLPKFCDACADHDGEITVHELGRVMRNHGLNPTGSVSIEIRLQILCHLIPMIRKNNESFAN